MAITGITINNTSVIEGASHGYPIADVTINGSFNHSVESIVTDGEIAIVTTNTEHNLISGNTVTLVGTDMYDGEYIVKTIIDTTTFSIPTTNTTSTGIGGTVYTETPILYTSSSVNIIKIEEDETDANLRIVTTTQPHNLFIDDSIYIKNTEGSNSDNTPYYDGHYKIVSIVSDTELKISSTNDIGYTYNGTIITEYVSISETFPYTVNVAESELLDYVSIPDDTINTTVHSYIRYDISDIESTKLYQITTGTTTPISDGDYIQLKNTADNTSSSIFVVVSIESDSIFYVTYVYDSNISTYDTVIFDKNDYPLSSITTTEHSYITLINVPLGITDIGNDIRLSSIVTNYEENGAKYYSAFNNTFTIDDISYIGSNIRIKIPFGLPTRDISVGYAYTSELSSILTFNVETSVSTFDAKIYSISPVIDLYSEPNSDITLEGDHFTYGNDDTYHTTVVLQSDDQYIVIEPNVLSTYDISDAGYTIQFIGASSEINTTNNIVVSYDLFSIVQTASTPTMIKIDGSDLPEFILNSNVYFLTIINGSIRISSSYQDALNQVFIDTSVISDTSEYDVHTIELSSSYPILMRFNDNEILFTLPISLDSNVYKVGVYNGYQIYNNSNILRSVESDINYIRYITDQATSKSLGNNTCYTKPSIWLVYDSEGTKGDYGYIMKVCPPSFDIEYEQVFLKYEENFDIATGGEVELDNIQLADGDKVWLSNQSIEAENGIYYVRADTWEFRAGTWEFRAGTWELYREVDDTVFVDLGARAYDAVDGDLSRQIITGQHIDFGVVGFYTITYYVLNSQGVLSTVKRKVKVVDCTASLVPTDSYVISDYLIKAEADASVLDPDNILDSCDACALEGGGTISGTGELDSSNLPIVGNNTTFIRSDGTIKFTANQSMGGHRLTSLADPVDPTDAVNLRTLQEFVRSSDTIGNTYTAGEVISLHSVVMMSTDGMVYVADSSDLTHMDKILGVAITNQVAGGSVSVVTIGTIDGFSGLIVGTEYFVSSGGALTITPPTTGFTQVMGIATSATEFLVKMGMPMGV